MKHFTIDRLRIAPENVRKRRSPADIEKLASSILHFGLLQNLVGYEADDGMIEITVGGTRLEALRLLAAQDAGDPFEIPVQVRNRETAVADSLAENEARTALNPADRVRAFRAALDKGMSPAEIQNAYSVGPKAYSNVMRIAGLPDEILDAMGENEMGYNHAAAFALGTHDQALALHRSYKEQGKIYGQEWGEITSAAIKRELTKAALPHDHPLVKFIGIDAYMTAGGAITSDLFSDDVFLDEPELVKALATDKLAHIVAKDYGDWSWHKTSLEYVGWDEFQAYGRTYPEVATTATEDEMDEYDELLARCDDLDETEKARYAEIDAKIEADTWTDAQKSVAGVLVYLHSGFPQIRPGLIKPEDRARAIELGVMEPDRTKASASPVDDGAWSFALREDMHILARAAMQCELMEKPERILDMLTDAVCGIAKHRIDFGWNVNNDGFLKMCEQGLVPNEMLRKAWEGKLPKGKGKAGRDARLIAASAARIKMHYDYTPNIRRWWTPNIAFFNRLTKPQMIEIVGEIGAGRLAGTNNTWDKYKKGDLAAALAGFFDGTTKHGAGYGDGSLNPEAAAAVKAAQSWLPPMFRDPDEDEANDGGPDTSATGAASAPGDDVDSQPADSEDPEGWRDAEPVDEDVAA